MQSDDPHGDGRPWYTLPRPVPTRPTFKRLVAACALGAVSYGLVVWWGSPQSWPVVWVEEIGVAVSITIIALLAHLRRARRRHA